jgi:3-methyladenine DNA glycosylase AlkD
VSALDDVRAELAAVADPRRAEAQFRYLQMGPGGYGEGDRCIGVPVPMQRRIAGRHWRQLTVAQAGQLLRSPIHEERLTAIFILVQRFRRGDPTERQAVYDLVLATTTHVDNWDLVDSLAPYVVGPWLTDPARPSSDRSVLDRLADSPSVWERRVAVMATFAFIKVDDYDWTFHLAQRLLRDPHDLIHKAVGWMLREVGNRDRPAEQEFLDRHHGDMPRVMLRYAIEKFDEPTRRAYLTGQV